MEIIYIKNMVDARKHHKTVDIEDVHGLTGVSVDEAYAIQQQIIIGLNKTIVGWKLGGTNAKTRSVFNVNKLYWGAVFSGGFVEKSPDLLLAKGEVEVAFQLLKSVENLKDTIDEKSMSKYVRAVALSVEYPWSVFSDFGNAGVTALIADCCASGMCLLGDAIPYDDFKGSAKIEVFVDGGVRDKGSTDSLIDGVFVTLCDFLNNAISSGFDLKENQWVFSGGLTACRSYTPKMKIEYKCDVLPNIYIYNDGFIEDGSTV